MPSEFPSKCLWKWEIIFLKSPILCYCGEVITVHLARFLISIAWVVSDDRGILTYSEFWWWRWHLSNVVFNISVSKCGFLFSYNDPNHLLLIYLLKRQVFFFSSLSLFLIICSNCVVVSLALPQALYRKDLVLAFVEHWHWVFFSFGLRCSPRRQSSIKGGPGKSFNVLVQKSN